MEMAKITTKSLLKKGASLNISKTKKVTFNNTVKVFINDHSKTPKLDNAFDAELKFVEVSVPDKTDDAQTTDSYEDCKATDFLVHKVIYDNYLLPENDEDLDFKHDAFEEDPPVLFDSEKDNSLDFVVHKVTEHEDDLIKQDPGFDLDNDKEGGNVLTLDLKEGVETTKFSKLSIENILEHDKIIAYIDQKNLGLSSIHNTPTTEKVSNSKFQGSNDFFSSKPEKLENGLVLSPPLQELSLEKIVKAHSNNILCELDISPLNSVQETDSDSDLSSEGTMIMMTTEECQKNEQHIRESLLQYQSLKEKRDSQSSDSDSEHSSTRSVPLPSACDAQDEVLENHTSQHETTKPPEQACSTLCEDEVAENLSGSSPLISKDTALNSTYNSSLPDASLTKEDDCNAKFQNEPEKFSSENNPCFKKKHLTSVEIPKDVREWKILSNSLDKNSLQDFRYIEQNESIRENPEFFNQHSKEFSEIFNGHSKPHLDIYSEHSEQYSENYNKYFKQYPEHHNEFSKQYSVPHNEDTEQSSDHHNDHSKQYIKTHGYSRAFLDAHSRYSDEYLNGYSKGHQFFHNEHYNGHLNISHEHSNGYKDIPNEHQVEHFNTSNGYSYFHAPNPSAQDKSYLDVNNTSGSHSQGKPTPKIDELENFVHESSERVERIRKRYHSNGRQPSRQGLSRQSPVRGIKPRFGSTAEILQLMQKNNNPPFITFSGGKNHMSWPCEETSSNPELNRSRLQKHSHCYADRKFSSECSSQSSIDSYSEDQLNSSCDYSISSCPSIIINSERGVPEGASPPNYELETDLPYTGNNENPNGFVYFSMKV